MITQKITLGIKIKEYLLGGSAAECLTLAQGVILGPGIESHIGFPAWSLLLPLPASLPRSLCLS